MTRDAVRPAAFRGRIRFLGEEAVLFDPVTWSTHVLNPGAARLARLVSERGIAGPVTWEDAVALASDELGWDPDDPSARQTLDGFVDAELIQPPPAG